MNPKSSVHNLDDSEPALVERTAGQLLGDHLDLPAIENGDLLLMLRDLEAAE